MTILFRLLTLFLLLQAAPLHAEQTVTLAAGEPPPMLAALCLAAAMSPSWCRKRST